MPARSCYLVLVQASSTRPVTRSPVDTQGTDTAVPAGTRRRALTHAQMYERLLANDASYNGRFFTGVLTTGIYCLPSCRARKPKSANVRFFPSVEMARAAGLRPCRKCHPDDFARGADPVLEQIETLAAEIRANPSRFAGVAAVVHRAGFGATRLFELFRQHYHTTPADFLLRARLAIARTRLATTDESVAAIAYAAGFETLSVFHENFRRFNGLTPAAYRQLRTTRTFSVALTDDYPRGYLQRALSRDPHSVTERFADDTYRAGVWLDATPAVLTLQFAPKALHVAISAGSAFAAHALVVGLAGLEQDSAAFVRAVRQLGLARLVAGRAGLRISQTPSVFDGLLWAIIGQQINFPFACLLKRRLIERTSHPLEDGLYVPPTPEAIARIEPADLLPLQFSRQKANYVVMTARLVASGQLDLAKLLTMSATRAERTLLAVHGLGPWSVNYLMMRSLGFLDCVPLGDTGVTSGLQSLFSLDHRPDRDETLRLMRDFSPYRSLATTHLWQLDRPLP